MPNVLSSALKEQRTETALGTGLKPMKNNVFIRPLFILCFNSLTYLKPSTLCTLQYTMKNTLGQVTLFAMIMIGASLVTMTSAITSIKK